MTRSSGTGLFLLAAAWALHAFLREAPPKPEAPAKNSGLPGYEGSDGCRECHSIEHEQWRGSTHARTVHEPSESEKQLLRRSLLCGDEDAAFILGERHARRFMIASPGEPGKHVMLPCRYDVGPAEWVGLHESDWKTLTWEKECGACHTAGFSSDDYSFRELGVGCEACHGPGSRHGEHATSGKMISFGALPAKGEVTICASCHLQGGKSRATGLNYARNYVAGDDLFDDYQFDWGKLNSTPENADNPIDIHQKLLIRDATRASADTGNQLRCTSCHEFHRMGHDKHEKLARQEFCYLCHARADFKVKEYNQSCNVCEF